MIIRELQKERARAVQKLREGRRLAMFGVAPPRYWLIAAKDVQLGGSSLGLCMKHVGCSMVLDTGTSVLLGPPTKVTGNSRALWRLRDTAGCAIPTLCDSFSFKCHLVL